MLIALGVWVLRFRKMIKKIDETLDIILASVIINSIFYNVISSNPAADWNINFLNCSAFVS